MKTLRELKDNRAFTLVELIVSITIISIMLGAIIFWILGVTRSINKTTAEAEMKNQARQALETIVKDMRSSSTDNIEVYNFDDAEVDSVSPTLNPISFSTSQDINTGRLIKANGYWYRIFCYDTANQKYALYRYPYSVSNNGAMPAVDRDSYKFVEDIRFDAANQKYGLQITLIQDDTADADENKDNFKTYKLILNMTRRAGADIVTQDVQTTLPKSVIED